MKIARLLFVLLLAGAAGAREGGLPGAFLEYGGSARSIALGKAFTGVADDPQAGFFNPGGLFQLNASEVLAAHSQLHGARLEYIGYALPTREFGTFAFSLLNHGAEGLDSRTPENLPWQSFAAAENALLASYCYGLWHRVGFGATAKIVSQNIAQYSGIGVGLDAGVLVRGVGPFSFGLTGQNLLQPTLTLASLPDVYPRNLRAGVGIRLLDGRVLVAADAVAPLVWDVDEDGNPVRRFTPRVTPHVGLEFDIVPRVLIQRVGFDKNDLSLGLGLHRYWGRMGIGADYAFLLHHQSNYRLAPTHKVGVFLSFAGFRVWIDAQPRVFSPTPDQEQNVLWMDINLVGRAPAKRWQVLIKNHLGEVVRTFNGWDTPPLRLSWDGLDDAGRLVPDGEYRYEIIVVDQRNAALEFAGPLTRVRTRGPEGRIEIRPGE
ncbi:MAG: FlgD immunoglobulin-like domain containing protein [bacterium]